MVGAAVLMQGRCLAAQRAPGTSSALLWEFPGGKIEPGESAQSALQRELLEELAITVEVGEFVGRGEAMVTGRRIVLDVFLATIARGIPRPLEHHALRWCSHDELLELEWAAPDVPILHAVQARLRATTSRQLE